MHIVHCTSCNKEVGVPDGAQGKHVRCPHCKNIFLAPLEGRTQAVPDVAEPEQIVPLLELSIEDELAAAAPQIEPRARDVPVQASGDDLLPPPTPEKEDTGAYRLLDEEEPAREPVKRRPPRPPVTRRPRRQREEVEPLQPLQPLQPARGLGEASRWSRPVLLVSLAPLGILLVALLASASGKMSVGGALALGLGLSLPLSLLCVSVAWLRWGVLTVQGRIVLCCIVITVGYLLALLVIALAADGKGAKKRSEGPNRTASYLVW